jgi:hypothetical protein
MKNELDSISYADKILLAFIYERCACELNSVKIKTIEGYNHNV